MSLPIITVAVVALLGTCTTVDDVANNNMKHITVHTMLHRLPVGVQQVRRARAGGFSYVLGGILPKSSNSFQKKIV
jgi:hypothetical protein